MKREVSRLKNIKLERHRNIKFDSQIISKKIVKYSFIIEEFLSLSPEDQKYYFCLHDAFQYLSSDDKVDGCPDLETLGRIQLSKRGQDLI